MSRVIQHRGHDLFFTNAQYHRVYSDLGENANWFHIRRVIADKLTQDKVFRDLIFSIHGRFCKLCLSLENLQMDHVVPITKLGTDCTFNFQPLCKRCNSRKGNR